MSTQKSYLIAPQTTIRVKLGKSVTPESRRKTLQTGSSDQLLLLAQSDRIQEADLHRRFAEYRGGNGGTEFFDIPLDKFLLLFLEYAAEDPEGTRALLGPPLVQEEQIPIEWSRISVESSKKKIGIYTLKQLQQIARQLKVPSSGLTKAGLATELLQHRPEQPEKGKVKIVPEKTLLSRILDIFF
jgi:hypothetical protein